MKRLVISTLSLLTLSSLAAPAFAGEISFKKSNRNVIAANIISKRQTKDITPFNLVTRSYQGSFANQGIPSNAAFTRAVSTGKITASDLVESAIANDRLNPETLNDAEYIYNVQSYLDGLDND